MMNQSLPHYVQFQNHMEDSPLGGALGQLFLSYATHAISEKSIPQLGDGMLPVHRRQVLAMQDLNAVSKNAHMASSKITSHAQGNYHPAGDNYQQLVTISQDWKVQLMLTDPEGNWGPMEGTAPAADRYTKNRLSIWGEKILLADLPSRQKAEDDPHGIVPQKLNYDSTVWEEQYLPARLPMLIINGGTGIAVAIAQSWPQLNVRDVILEYNSFLRTGKFHLSRVSFGYPTRPVVAMEQHEVTEVLERGHGVIKMAGKWHEENGRVVFTSMPPDTSLNQIGDKANEWLENVTCPIKEFRNESPTDGIRLVFVLKPDVSAEEAAPLIMKKCGLSDSKTIQQYVLHNGRPALLGITAYLEKWTDLRHGQLQRISNREILTLTRDLRRLAILEFTRDHLTDCDENVSYVLRTAVSPEEIHKRLLVHKAAQELDLQLSEIKQILDLNLRSVSRLNDDEIKARRTKWAAELEYHTKVRDDKDFRIGVLITQAEEIYTELGKQNYPDYRSEIKGRAYAEANNSVLSKLRPKGSTLREIIEEPGETDIILVTAAGFIVRLPTRSITINKSRPSILNGNDMIVQATFHDRANIVIMDDEGKFSVIKKADMDAKASIRYPLLNSQFGTKISGNPKVIVPSAQPATKLVIRYGTLIKALDMEDQLPSTRAIVKSPPKPMTDVTTADTAIIIHHDGKPVFLKIDKTPLSSRARIAGLPSVKQTAQSVRVINKASIHTDGRDVWRVNY